MTRRNLPPCSVPSCDRAAGVVLDEALLCAEHASEALKRRKRPDPGKSGYQESGWPIHCGGESKGTLTRIPCFAGQ